MTNQENAIRYSKMTDGELQKERDKQISIMDLACATDKPDDCRMTKTFVDNLLIIDAQLMARCDKKVEGLKMVRTILEEIKISSKCGEDDELKDHVSARDFTGYLVEKILVLIPKEKE